MHTRVVMRSVFLLGISALIHLAAPFCYFTSLPANAQTPCPMVPQVDVSSRKVPDDVCIPIGFGRLPIDFFDDYSWRTFIAMVWPAAQDQRGTPDPILQLGERTGALVFETFKSEWEIFTDNNVPSSN